MLKKQTADGCFENKKNKVAITNDNLILFINNV